MRCSCAGQIAQLLSIFFAKNVQSYPNYKVFGMIINMDWEGEKLIYWLHERCGKSEKAHAVMKDDLAGGKLPSVPSG